MINLLPPATKENISYGRRNLVLVRWVAAVVTVIVSIGIITAGGQIFINKNIVSLQKASQITQNRTESKDFSATQNDIKNLSNNFTVVTQLLSKQVLFSKIFTKIGSIMPSGAILSGITLSNTSTSLDLNIASVNRDAATQAFVNISDPKNGLFDKADLVSLVCRTGSGTSQTKYPCNANISVTIKANSSFYFLSSITNKGSQQ